MTEIVVGVRLNADGSGLVGQLRLSSSEMDQLRVAQKGAAGAARDLSQATAGTASAQQAAAASMRDAAAASAGKAVSDRGAAGAAREATAATAGLTVVDRAAADAARLLISANDQAAASFARKVTEGRKAAFQLSDLSERSAALVRAERAVTQVTGLQRAGWQQFGYQLQDIGIQYSLNTRLSQIFAMQSGQLFAAISMIAQGSEKTTGSLGRFATLMGGPWGIAIGTAVSLGTLLWSELTKIDEASDDAARSAINFSSSLVAQQAVVATSADGIRQLEEATKSLINTQAILVDNLRQISQSSVSQLRTQLAGLDREIADKSNTANSLLANIPGTFGIFGDGGKAQSDVAKLTALRSDIVGRLASAERSLTSARVSLEERAAVERADPDAAARGDIERRRARLRERRQYTLDLQTGGVPLADAPSLEQISAADFDRQMAELTRREIALKNQKKPKKDNSAAKAAREAERLAQFGERAEDAIARLNDQFNAAPRDIDQARAATEKLDDIIADLEKRKPKNFETLIAQAQAVKPLIQDSLIRPIRDMLDDQRRQIELGRLQLAGRQADADALQLTYQLMDKMGVESEEQLATELAKRGVTQDQARALYDNLGVMRQQTREMRVQQQIQQVFLTAVNDMRENVRLTVEELRRGAPQALENFGKRFVDVFDRLFSETLTEKLFGNFFRELEDQITGGDKVSKAGEKMADAVNRASKDIKQTSGDIVDLGKAVRQAKADIAGTGPAGSIPPGWIVGDNGEVFDPNAPITVTAGKNGADILGDLKKGFREGYEEVFDGLKKSLDDIFHDVFGDKGVFSKSLGNTLGRVAGNAQLGGLSGNLVTDLFGLKGSSTGGALGGAIGGELAKAFLPQLGPLGSIIGGTLGSVVGGLLKKTKTGAANITSVDGDASLSGNSSKFKEAASGAASSVQDGLSQIAEMLGGGIGAFNVTIGQRHGDWRVRTGTGSLKINKGAKEFDDDQAGAIAYAIQLAVSQGAVTGISAAIQQALRSSTDINKALEEALKVQEVETLLGGLGAQLEAQFKAFENQAKERVRIATQYGFDVVEIEKRNAEDRAKLVDQILSDRVGSLQTLLNDIKFGSLYEGSAADQRQALLAQIVTARADAEAGKDGAADTLAALSRQLIELSREAYGTAGAEYGADRDLAANAAEQVIKSENDRIKAAQAASAATNDKLDTANKLAEEQTDLLARIAGDIAALSGGRPSSAPPAVDLSTVVRTS